MPHVYAGIDQGREDYAGIIQGNGVSQCYYVGFTMATLTYPHEGKNNLRWHDKQVRSHGVEKKG